MITSYRYDDVRPFSEGMASVKLNGKWGYIDIDENEIIKLMYDGAESFSDAKVNILINREWI